jgi:menaquinone-dependent protoporphyrinogen oxidase
MRVLVTAATRHGSTGEIAAAIGREIARHGVPTTVVPPVDVADLDDVDAVVLGSAVYAGHWLEPATALVDRCGPTWASRPVWLFSSGPVGDPARKLVQRMAADPFELPHVLAATRAREHRMFAGRLAGADLGLAQRAAVRLVRGLEGDFRNWDEITAWAAGIGDALGPRRQREALDGEPRGAEVIR